MSPVILTTRISISQVKFFCQASALEADAGAGFGSADAGGVVGAFVAGAVGALGRRTERVASGLRRPI